MVIFRGVELFYNVYCRKIPFKFYIFNLRDINESPPLRDTLRNPLANDTTYGSIKARQKRSSSYTYCVHGNKYGFSKCCKDLHVELDDDSLNCSHDVENNISQARNSTRSSGSKWLIMNLKDFVEIRLDDSLGKSRINFYSI